MPSQDSRHAESSGLLDNDAVAHEAAGTAAAASAGPAHLELSGARRDLHAWWKWRSDAHTGLSACLWGERHA